MHADEKLSAFVELERQVLTVTFYLESIHFRFVQMTNDASGLDSIFVTDAHRGDRKRFVVRADEKLTAFVEPERPIHEFAVDLIS